MTKVIIDHEKWMKAAFREAEKAFEQDEVPIGAVVVQNGQIIGRGYNQCESLIDPTAHAEIIAITSAANTIKDARKENPKWIRKDIKANCNSEFFLLYYHDKTLLESLLPEKTRPIPPNCKK